MALAAAAALLFGCDQRPYPSPTQDPAPTTPPAELMGAPAPPPTNQTTAAQPETPAPVDTPPPSPEPLRAPDVSMAPIPNPPEGPARPAPTTAAKALMGQAPSTPPVHPATPRAAPAHAATKSAAATPGPAPLTEAALSGAALSGAPVAKYDDHGPKVDAFLSEARKALRHGSQLRTPAKSERGQKADVALVLPASFAQTLRKAAETNGLISAGAPINVTAALTAPGFKVEPTAPQLQPLQSGQPTEFHWSLTPEEKAARGPMKASVCVEAPSGAEPLCLGDVGPSRPGLHVNSQVLGAALLIVIVSLVIAWLARGRRSPPSRSAAARRAAKAAAAMDEARPYST